MADVKTTVDRVDDVLRGIAELARSRVMVGIPENKDARRDGDRAGNALIGLVHEHGSPAKNIPARPWLRPGVQQGMPRILTISKNIGKAALDGKIDVVEQGFHAVGLAAVNAVRARISSNIPPPLSPRTIAARRRRTKGSKYRRKAKTASEVVTLIDTAQLRNAVSYVVRKT